MIINSINKKNPPKEAGINLISNNNLTQDELLVNHENEMMEAALKYAEAGYKVFPVKENGKAPATAKGFHEATDNPEQVKKWWTENPNYNIGLPMALNGFVAIDIDRHGETDGFINLENYLISYGLSDLPITVEALTANNGRHKIFRVPNDFKPVGKLTEGVDIKYNGYIVISPSRINSNQYEWITEQGLLDMQPENLPVEWTEHLINPETSNYNDKTALKNNYPVSKAEIVAEKCNFIKHCIDNSLTLSEPDWKFGLISTISFCENGNEYIHKWSENYNGYTWEETEKKINDSLKFGHPITCKGIQKNCSPEYCNNCGHNGNIKTPIVLGYDKPACENLEEPEIQEPEPNLDFPIDVFPEKIREFILNASHVMDAPKEYFAVAIMAATAFLINSQAFLKVKNIGWAEPAILWITIVGEAGKKKKSPVYKLIKAILDVIDKELENKYLEEMEEFYVEKLKYDVDLKSWKNKGITTIQPPLQPKEPVRTLIYTSDTTIEGLSYHQSRNPHGIGIMRDEIAGFIEGFNKYSKGGNDRQYYLSAFTGDEYMVSRKNDMPFKVKPFHNIFGGIQPSKVEHLLLNDLKVTDGFTERFLFCLTNYKKRAKMVNIEINEDLKKHLEGLMESIYGYFNKEEITYFELDKEAKIKLFEIFDILDRETLNDNKHELLHSYLEKIKTCIPRFALVLHCLNDFKEQYINKNTIESAFKIANYFIDCFICITKIAIKIKCNSLENYTIQWLKLNDRESITPSKLYLSNKTRYKGIEKARECLYSIANSGFGKIVKINGGEKWVNAGG